MYRHRNRPAYSPEELAELYEAPHQHTRWRDHIQRVEKTIEVGRRQILGEAPHEVVIADLSCGDGAIGRGVLEEAPCCGDLLLGDFAPGYDYHGPIEETIDQIPHVNLFVCSETIEHLDDPDAVLARIRDKSDMLLLSTPNCSWVDPNPEHYWSWDDAAVREMLAKAGWTPGIYEESLYIQPDGRPLGYRYQIWGCV